MFGVGVTSRCSELGLRSCNFSFVFQAGVVSGFRAYQYGAARLPARSSTSDDCGLPRRMSTCGRHPHAEQQRNLTLNTRPVTNLKVHVTDGAFWLAVNQSEAKLLQDYAIGNSEGGPSTAQNTWNAIRTLTDHSAQLSTLTSVRLSPEECVFLAHAVGTIHFVRKAAGPCSAEALWHSCVQENPCFVHSYIAYHHFRSKGWIPRSGLQYGTDLVLYEQHPSLVHSTVCVLIVVTPFAGEDCRPPAVCNSGARMDGQDGTLSWHDVEGINRLCVRVGKRLMLFYIQPQCDDLDVTSPACLANFAVAEHMVERWVPEATINLM